MCCPSASWDDKVYTHPGHNRSSGSFMAGSDGTTACPAPVFALTRERVEEPLLLGMEGELGVPEQSGGGRYGHCGVVAISGFRLKDTRLRWNGGLRFGA